MRTAMAFVVVLVLTAASVPLKARTRLDWIA